MSDKALELITMKRQNAVNQVKKSNRIYFFSLLLLLVILQQRRIIFFVFWRETIGQNFTIPIDRFENQPKRT